MALPSGYILSSKQIVMDALIKNFCYWPDGGWHQYSCHKQAFRNTVKFLLLLSFS
jgi:hypothetical protein